MRRPLIAVAIAALFSLLASADAGNSAAAQSHAWGSPPPNDVVHFDPNLPQIGRWFTRIPDTTEAQFIALDSQRLYAAYGAALHAYDLDTGSVVWSCPGFPSSNSFLFSPDGSQIAFANGDLISLISASDGKVLWSQSGLLPLAFGHSGVWASRIEHIETYPWTVSQNLLLLDTPSGAVLHEFTFKEVGWVEAAPESGGGADVHAFADGAVRALSAAGELWSVPAGGARKTVGLIQLPAGLFVQEYNDYMKAEDLPMTEFPLTMDLRLSLLDRGTGKQLWVVRPTLQDQLAVFDPPVQLVGDMLLIEDEVSVTSKDGKWSSSGSVLKLLSQTDGRLSQQIYEPCFEDRVLRYFAMPNSSLALQIEHTESESERSNLPDSTFLLVIEPVSGVAHKSELPGGMRYFDCDLVNGKLCCVSQLLDLAPGQHGSPVALACRIDLSADGQVINTVPRLTGFDSVNASSAAAFMATAEPLSDDELMRSVVAQGLTAVSSLFKQFPQMNEAQREALLELSIYIQPFFVDRWAQFNPLPELLNNVVDTAAMREHPGQLALWFKDPRLSEYRFELEGALALCGGAEAKVILDPLYASMFDQSIAQPAPPYYLLDWNATEPRFDPQLHFKAPNGDGYNAFVCGNLAGSLIWLGRDDDADGRNEAVYPTDLTNVHGMFFLPYGYAGAEVPPTPLELQFMGDYLSIRHNEYVDDEARAREDTRSLEEILRDSDGDGWTDLTELRLFTDAQSSDSDGDGLPDAQDRFPGIDPARLGRLERGISRALYLELVRRNEGVDYGGGQLPSPMPVDVQYLSAEGCGPVCCRYRDQQFVCAETPEKRQQLADFYDNGNELYMRVRVITIDKNGRRSDADQDDYFPSMPNYEYTGEYVVDINFIGAGTELELKDVEGELFPTNVVGGWIS